MKGRRNNVNCCGNCPTQSVLCPKLHTKLILLSESEMQIASSLCLYNQACGWPPPQELEEHIKKCLPKEVITPFLRKYIQDRKLVEYIRNIWSKD